MAPVTVTAPTTLDEGVKKRKLTVKELYALGDLSLIAPEERVELIGGELYVMTPPSSQHSAVVSYLDDAFQALYRGHAIIRVQDPVYFTEYDFVEPDIAVLKYRDDFYGGAHPTPADVLWLVEVSKTTLGYDKTKKLMLYARLNIAEVWLVNLQEHAVEVYRQPSSAGYGESLRRGVGEAVAPLAFPGQEVVVLPVALL